MQLSKPTTSLLPRIEKMLTGDRTIAVVGAQFGDEGKGKIVELLALWADIIVRFNGGNNAGHTIYVDNKPEVLHLLPCAIFQRGKICVVGQGVVVDLEVLKKELGLAKGRGSIIRIDRRAPVILPIYKQIDGLREAANSKKLGTTGRGIGPAYEAHASRYALRMGDLTSASRIREALNRGGNYYAQLCAAAKSLGGTPQTEDDLVKELLGYSRMVKNLLYDTVEIVRKALGTKKIMFEGAQAALLDVNQGTTPFVTSSSCTIAGIYSTFGQLPIDRVFGVAKAYVTRVGEGPFPSKIVGEMAHALREAGNEYGSTTKRPRDVGWMDLFALRYAVQMGGITDICLTKADVLNLWSQLQVCTKYMHGKNVAKEHRLMTAEYVKECTPVFEEVEGWHGANLTGIKLFGDLPPALQQYIRDIAAFLGVPVSMIGIGPCHDDIIFHG